MLYNTFDPILQMIKGMVKNQESPEKIMSFIDSIYPKLYKDLIKEDIKACQSCNIYKNGKSSFDGPINADIMFIGEAPGEEEVKSGEPFIGSAGQLLDKMLLAASEKINPRWNRDNIYITNVIKCRPMGEERNRKPNMQEIANCKCFLDKEINIVNPKIIVCLGSTAAEVIIHPDFKITDEHGIFFGNSPKIIAIYHPSFILHAGENTEKGKQLKKQVWEDLIKINKEIGD